MRYKVTAESRTRDDTGIVICNIRSLAPPWRVEEKQFLCLYGKATREEGNKFEAYDYPSFVRLTQRQEKALWKAIDSYRRDEDVESKRQAIEDYYKDFVEKTLEDHRKKEERK